MFNQTECRYHRPVSYLQHTGVSFLLFGFSKSAPASNSNIIISTSMGDIVIRLREDVAPKHAAFMKGLIAKKVRNRRTQHVLLCLTEHRWLCRVMTAAYSTAPNRALSCRSVLARCAKVSVAGKGPGKRRSALQNRFEFRIPKPLRRRYNVAGNHRNVHAPFIGHARTQAGLRTAEGSTRPSGGTVALEYAHLNLVHTSIERTKT